MKKSEKIEIRVSLEEKEQLARLAESEGRNVSELVRNLASRYAQINTPRPPAKRSPVFLSALMATGLAIGAGLTYYGLGGFDTPEPGDYMVHGVIEEHAFGFTLPKETMTSIIGVGDRAYDFNVTGVEGRPSAATFSICKRADGGCAYPTEVTLDMDEDIAPSVWQVMTPEGDRVFLVMQPYGGDTLPTGG